MIYTLALRGVARGFRVEGFGVFVVFAQNGVGDVVHENFGNLTLNSAHFSAF